MIPGASIELVDTQTDHLLATELQAEERMTVGQVLQRARESRGISIAKAAATTRILPETIRAIESDDFRALPSPVYVRGFVHSLATFLEADTEAILLLFDRQVALPGPGDETERPLAPAYGERTVEPEAAQPGVQWAVPAAAAALLAIGLLLFGLRDSVEEPTVMPEANAVDADSAGER